ncbi:tigger transposable element-derived protein 1-like [Equus przewalskii]|uniref:Tigger transposable element-derived protein 1-like n=1 Tax=Equus przewalskii TaxID=9798 RepID=A0ABM4KD48_EQUPR|nr:PREDICTED: tigger transposable element-derived protein 1-like [Equus przewalskii]
MAPKFTKYTVKVARKRPCEVIDLEMKFKVIKDNEGGKSVMVVAHQSGMSHSTIATILKNKNKVMEAFKGSASLKAMKLTKIQEGPTSDLEKLVMTWIEDQTQKGIPLSTITIMAKSKILFVMVQEKTGPYCDIEFTASSAGLSSSRIIIIHNVKGNGESADADVKTGEEHLESLDKLIVEKNYLPEQIFNMDKISLFWKWMPGRTFIHKEATSIPDVRALFGG